MFAALGVTLTATAGETVTVKLCDPVTLCESVALTVKLEVPALCGVPETIPLLVLSDSPAGNCPEESANVYGAVPLLAVTATL